MVIILACDSSYSDQFSISFKLFLLKSALTINIVFLKYQVYVSSGLSIYKDNPHPCEAIEMRLHGESTQTNDPVYLEI